MSASTPPPQQGGGFADIAGAPPPSGAVPQAELVGGIYGGTEPDPGGWDYVNGEFVPRQGGAQRPFVGPDGQLASGPIPLAPGSTGHTYYEGDQYRIVKALNTEDLVRVQQQLAAVGLAGNPLYGEVDDTTLTAMTKLLSLSNRSGTSWDATLTRLSTNPLITEGAEGDTPEFEPSPFLQPDYASLAQEVKATFRQRLGRDPDQYEMQQLTGELTGFYAAEHEAQNELQRIRFDQQATEGVQSGGSVQAVDPVARFKEAFESRYANELDFVEDKQEAVETRETIQQGVGTLSAMSGGQ